MRELSERGILGNKLLTACFDITRDLVAALPHLFCIGECEFEVDNLDIFVRLNSLFNMQDVWIIKETHELKNGIRLADVREELIPKPLAIRSALHESCDVYELYCRGDRFLAL